MKTTREMIEVMEAHERGEEIYANAIFGISEWILCTDPRWMWDRVDYHIAEKTKTKVTYWRPWIRFADGTLCPDPSFKKDKDSFQNMGRDIHHWECMEVEE